MSDQEKVAIVEETLNKALNALHESKPSQNLSISETKQSSEEILEKLHETLSFGKNLSVSEVKSDESSEVKCNAPEKTEHVNTVSDKPSKVITTREPDNQSESQKDNIISNRDSDNLSESRKEPRTLSRSHHETPTSNNAERKPRLTSAASDLNQGDRITKNQNDIFTLNEETSIASSIFSINGSPSRKLYRKKELPRNNVFPLPVKEDPPADKVSPKEKVKDHLRNSYGDLKRPSSSIRNPLTGTGLSSNDEYKCNTTKRRDGNPLLGLGYSPEATPSTHRIPPGGFSHKLW